MPGRRRDGPAERRGPTPPAVTATRTGQTLAVDFGDLTGSATRTIRVRL
ncbi:hypothetical protein Q5530_26775 [Saccharothrix sp. BKS2]